MHIRRRGLTCAFALAGKAYALRSRRDIKERRSPPVVGSVDQAAIWSRLGIRGVNSRPCDFVEQLSSLPTATGKKKRGKRVRKNVAPLRPRHWCA